MNDPQSTIDDFASRLTDLSLLTPLHTHHPRHVDNSLSVPAKSTTKLSLPRLLHTILVSISQNALPLDPTLPILHTPHTVPLKRVRPSADPSALLPDLVESFATIPDPGATTAAEHEHPKDDDDDENHHHHKSAIPPPLPGDDPFPAYLTLQTHHLRRVSHYNYTTYEITPTRTTPHPTQDFLDELLPLLNDAGAFRARFGCALRSADTVALLAAHKPAREAVVPMGGSVFAHARARGKACGARAARAGAIAARVRTDEGGVRYRGWSARVAGAWGVCACVVGVVAGALAWALSGGVAAVALGVVQVVLLSLVLSLGVGSEFRRCVRVLGGWQSWESEKDVVRGCGMEGRDALVAALWSGEEVDEVVSAFGFGQGVRVAEWCYDARFGIFVGERVAFAVRGRRWFRVVREGGRKGGRYRLFPGGKRKGFVGLPMGVTIVDGGRKHDIV